MAKRPRNRHSPIAAPATVAVTQNNAAVPLGNVEYKRGELMALEEGYALIRDCLEGSAVVKSKRELYLPIPNAADTSDANVARYGAYVQRAVFYNVVRRTLAGLVGQVYLQTPVVKVPTTLNPVVKDANGSGVTLVQLSKQAMSYVVAYGRAGALADYPTQNGPVTRAQQMSGEIRPTITVYAPWDIINWRTTMKGSKVLLSLVVLKETYDKEDDGFEAKTATQYRVLRLVDGIYTVEIWRSGDGGKGYAPVPEMTVNTRDAKGNLLTEIPFTFLGAENNDPDPDPAPMYDLADLNIAHYRNSADYEEACFITGQPTPWFAGLTQSWVDEVFKGQVTLGSRAAIPLPEGGSAGLLQVVGNTMPFEAMEQKERQMVSIGAKLVEQKSVQRTAEEASQDKASETSALVTMTENVSAGLQWVLEWCAIFDGAITEREDALDSDNRKVMFELNKEFELSRMTSDQIRTVIEAWVKEAITTTEMRKRLTQTGMAFQNDDDYKDWADEQAEEAARQAALFANSGDDFTPPGEDDGEDE